MNRYDYIEYGLKAAFNKLCDMLEAEGLGRKEKDELTKAIVRLEEMLWDAEARSALERERKVQAFVTRNPEAHPMSGMVGEY